MKNAKKERADPGIDELLAQSSLEEMARLAVLAVLETCSVSDQLAVMDALRPSWRAWSQLVDLAEIHAERCERVARAAKTWNTTQQRYIGLFEAAAYEGDVITAEHALNAAEDELRAALAELESNQP